MKKLISPLLFILVLSACEEKEIPAAKTKGPTTIKGRYTIVNTDIPVPDIIVYMTSGGWPFGELVNETTTDSNGYFKMEIPDEFDHGTFHDDIFRDGYIASRQKGGAQNTLSFNNDGQTHTQDFETIPPAWVNVTLRNISKRKDFDVCYAYTQYGYDKIQLWNNMDSASNTFKLFGNMIDSFTLSFQKYVNNQQLEIENKVIKVTVPGFMVKDTIIDF